MNITDALRLFELSPPISKGGLKKAYRDALMVWHPDRFTGNNDLQAKAESKTYLINEAYALLSRIPDSEYPYRPAEKQNAQVPTGAPRFTTTPTAQNKPQAAAVPPPIPRKPAHATNQPQQTKSQSSPTNKLSSALANRIYTITACVVVCGGALFFHWFFNLQAPHKEPNQSIKIDAIAQNQEFENLRIRAESGDLDAQNDLGLAYEKGVGVAKDETKAIFWFRKAAEKGHPIAQFDLGLVYFNGSGVPKNLAEATKWFRLAANQNLADAQYNLGVCYLSGDGVPPDSKEAFKLFRLAAESGLPQAQTQLGFQYQQGDEIQQDFKQAIKWYSLAATQGEALAQFNLGVCCDGGFGIPKNVNLASKWYSLAAERGHPDAQYTLALMHLIGTPVPKDLVKAHMWYCLAVSSGFNAPKDDFLPKLESQMSASQVAEAKEMADVFKHVKFPKENNSQISATSFRPLNLDEIIELAEAGDASSQLKLYAVYTSGEYWAESYAFRSGQSFEVEDFQKYEVPKNEVLSIGWLHKAADQGLPEAQRQLGLLYLTGKVVTKNQTEAAKWLGHAADQNDAAAQCFLGSCYSCGWGVTKDLEAAMKLYRASAEQGYVDAQVWLAYHFASTDSGLKNLEEATKWYQKAADQGSQDAKDQLARINNNQSNVIGNSGIPLVSNDKTYKPTQVLPVEQMFHLSSDIRLQTGSVLVDRLSDSGGSGKLILDNGLIEDAHVKLVQNNSLAASYYVQGGERFSFDHIPDGTYQLLYCTGYGWNPAKRDFTRGKRAAKYEQFLVFKTRPRTEGSQIIITTDVLTLTLHKVISGNAKTSGISLDEFDRF